MVVREEVAEGRRRGPRTALLALLCGLLIAALVPAVAAAGPADGECDIPVLTETSPENEYECVGDLGDVTGVESGGNAETLPPADAEPEPIQTRFCPRLSNTSRIRAENVDCATARSIAARGAGSRSRTYNAMGFTCTAAGLPRLKVSCFRPAEELGDEPEPDAGDGEPAANIRFTRKPRR